MAGRTIGAVGEHGFLSRLLPRLPVSPDTVVGPGQDCAVVRCGRQRVLFTVDALVEGTHFATHWLSPYQLGRKSFLVNASDIAAMGGRPRFCVVGLQVRPAYRARDLSALQAGIVAAATACGAVVVGGNLARAAQLSIAIALLGEAPRRLVTRAGAQAGDHVYVSGTLGDAARAVRWLRGAQRGHRPAQALRRFAEPTPRLQAGRLLAESGIVSSMIDVSDGLLRDLGHICEQSGVGAVIRTAAVPRSDAYRRALGSSDLLALHGGEDYELLCTVPERNLPRLEQQRARLGCPITCVGRITAGRRLRVLGPDGREMPIAATGYDHFRTR